MLRFLTAGLLFGTSLLVSEVSFAQVVVGFDPNQGSV